MFNKLGMRFLVTNQSQCVEKRVHYFGKGIKEDGNG